MSGRGLERQGGALPAELTTRLSVYSNIKIFYVEVKYAKIKCRGILNESFIFEYK